MNQPVVIREHYAPAGARLLLLVVSVVLLIIYGFCALGTISTAHAGAFLGFGLAAFAAAFL